MKHKIITFVLLISITLLAGCKKAEESPYFKAVDAIGRTEYEAAIPLLDKAIESGCDLKDAYRAKGIAYLGMADYVKAEVFLTNALRESNGIIEERDIDTSYYLAVTKYKSWDKAEAVNILDSVIALRPANDTAYYMRGKIKLSEGDKDAAITDYDKAIELSPNSYEHYIRICEDLKGVGYESEGDEYINRAMSASGKKTDSVKGYLEYYQKDYPAARTDLENAKKSNDSATVELYLGRVYDALGDTEYALTIYQEAINKYPGSGKLYDQYALLQMGRGNYQQAIDTINQGIEKGGGDSLKSLMFNRAVAYEKLYDFKQAYEYMSEYCNKYPDDSAARRELTFLSSR